MLGDSLRLQFAQGGELFSQIMSFVSVYFMVSPEHL